MKKSITILALAFSVTGAFAQDLTSKKGEQMLPEAEDWSIGVNADPFLEYMGNFFGKSANNSAPTFNFLNSNNMIMGKYFTEAQMAYRASLRIGFGTVTQRVMVANRTPVGPLAPNTPNSYPNADPTVENEWKRSNTNIGLAVGIEKRRGKTRLQGFYGAELGINLSSTRDRFEYGNKLNAATATTNSTQVIVDTDDLFSGANNVIDSLNAPNITGMLGDARITDRKNGSTFSFGVRGFIGVEYFILPKISLGGEFGWGIGLGIVGKTTTVYESIGFDGVGPDQRIGTTTIEGARGGSFRIDTDNANSIFGTSASLRLNFHF